MAIETPGLFTYSEWALRMDDTGKASYLINLLSQNNGLLADMLAVQCTSGNSYEYTQVTHLPSPTRRAYNQGVARTMGGVAKQIATTAEYADWSVFDDSLARLGGNLNDLRAREDALHMEGMSQEVASDIFYASKGTDPLSFTGWANIYNTVTTSTSQIANNVIDCGGTGSTNASIWLMGWGETALFTIFPNGLPAGLQHVDLGRSFIADSSGAEFLGWRTWLQWNVGVCVADWRFGVRACNIDYTLFGGGTSANLITSLAAMCYKPPIMPAGVMPIQSSDAVPALNMPRFCFYLNRTVFLQLDLQAQNKTNLLLKMEEWDGHPILTYRGIPIRDQDALTISETRVV
jgi:hypothetical protein